MSKTFTCKELGGVCDEAFSGETLDEIMQKGMRHMQSDKEHMTHIATLKETTGETKEEWMKRMQEAFDLRAEDE